MTRREAPISPPVVLTVAGSDSGGGAGIQADLKTIEACGGFGTSAVTSVTAQNTQGVHATHPIPVENLDAQIAAVREDFDLAAVKTGMLATGEVIDLVVDHATDLPNLVVDPVMVAASGDRLLAEAAETAYERLVAESTLVTPNADEAEVLTGVPVENPEAAERAGRILVDEQGADAALVKGGHVPGDHVVDTLVTPGDAGTDELAVTTVRHDRVETDGTHGAGCTLSSAIATSLAHGDELESAVGRGIDLLATAVRYNVAVGQGAGSVHHLVELRDDASRASTVDLVSALVDQVCTTGWTDLVPATGLGLAAATPHAETVGDVAAVADRLDADEVAERTAPTDANPIGGPRAIRFAADPTLATILLAAREAEPAIRLGAIVDVEGAPLDPLDGTMVTVDGDAIADPHGKSTGYDAWVPAGILTTLGEADEPVAVTFSRHDPADDDMAAVFGTTTADLLDRLGRLVTC